MKLTPFIRPALLLGAIALGIFWHDLAKLDFMISWVLMIMLFFISMQINLKNLIPTRVHIYLALANILMGVIPAILFFQCGYPHLATAAFFIGMTPTATAAPVIIAFLGGNINFVLTAFLINNVAISIAMIFLMPFILNVEAPIQEMVRVFLHLLWVMGVPLFLAMVVRHFLPKTAELILRYKRANFFLWIIALSIIVARGAEFCFQHNEKQTLTFLIAGLAGLFCTLNFALGALLGGKKFRREASQSLGQKNTLYSTYLALTFTSPLDALGPTFYIFFHNTWNAIQLYFAERKKERALPSHKSETSK